MTTLSELMGETGISLAVFLNAIAPGISVFLIGISIILALMILYVLILWIVKRIALD